MMEMHPPHADHEPLMEINTTPLIDVMLVLLVMLIITIPTAWHSTELDLPPDSTQATPQAVVQLRIDAQGRWFWNNAPVTDRNQLHAKLKEAAQQTPSPPLQLQADPKAPYGQVLAVLANAQQLGLKQLGIQP